jgi:hypothetical protein
MDTTTGNVRDQITFRQDGTFAFDEFKTNPSDEDHVTGTFSASGGRLVMDGKNAKDQKSGHTEMSYYVNASAFLLGALLPTGAHEGVVGTWRGFVNSSIPPSVSNRSGEIEFRANGTARGTLTNGGSTQTYEGTFTEVAAQQYKVRFPVSSSVTISMTFRLVDNAALGDTVYQR